ncbi:MAG: small subunit ribosomal protein S1 [Cellvibrionaceae bacterium]|jgi:small subunit ribosomal protein S1
MSEEILETVVEAEVVTETEEVEVIAEAEEAVIDLDEVITPTGIDDLKRKMKLKGTVTRLDLYGAFINIGLGAPAILHISHLGKRVNRVADVLSKGDEVEVWVDRVDQASNMVNVTMNRPLAVEWSDLAEGNSYTGRVTRLENFGAFIHIGAEKEGLAHVSELSHEYVRHPREILNVDDHVQVKVLDFSRKKRRINLSVKALQEKPEASLEEMSVADLDYKEEDYGEVPTAMEFALRNAMGDDAPPSGGRKVKKKKKKGRRAHQNDVISRTLGFAED